MLQKEQTDKIELENYKLEPKAKEKREEMLIKIHQIKYMKIEGREKLCKIRSDKKAKILINRPKIAIQEILCEYEETLETMNEVIYARAYVITEKLKRKPKKFTNRRVNKKPCWKRRIEKEISARRG